MFGYYVWFVRGKNVKNASIPAWSNQKAGEASTFFDLRSSWCAFPKAKYQAPLKKKHRRAEKGVKVREDTKYIGVYNIYMI